MPLLLLDETTAGANLLLFRTPAKQLLSILKHGGRVSQKITNSILWPKSEYLRKYSKKSGNFGNFTWWKEGSGMAKITKFRKWLEVQCLENLLPYYNNNTNSIYRAMIFSSSASLI